MFNLWIQMYAMTVADLTPTRDDLCRFQKFKIEPKKNI